MKVGVIIPIVHDRYINGLLECIAGNSVQPHDIIVLDNSHDPVILSPCKTLSGLHVLRPPVAYGVNASWNYGIDQFMKKVNLISVLNDDLLLEGLFFEKLVRLAEKHKEASVFCPETITLPEMLNGTHPIGSESCSIMSRREGWAWTIKSVIAQQIPPIPKQLKTWCGDDWYWRHCLRLGRPWMKMHKTWCYHYVGQSCVVMNVRKDLKKEKFIFKTIL